MRIDKYLCFVCNITRSSVNKFIKENEILVNGKKIISKDYKIDENKDEILVNGEKKLYKKYVYYMLNKPKGVVSAVKDNIDKTVVEIVESNYEIVPVGRLDKDTTGLLILTNDGDYVHNATSPTNHVFKTYEAIVDNDLNVDQMREFEKGIQIKDDENKFYVTKECKIKQIQPKKYKVSICEGKFHQVKRMFKYFNVEVIDLKRVSFGNLELDNSLQEGESRLLTSEEEKIILGVK